MSSDESSDLSDVPSDIETEVQLTKKDGILKFFSKAPPPSAPQREKSPPRPKREPSPPHEYVLADNQDIAFIVLFRSRFNEAFPKSLTNFGPQELERDIVEPVPGEIAETFLCGVLGVLLNRKNDVKPGQYKKALEEAIAGNKSQWPKDWEGKNPLSGGASFTSMTPTERLTLLRALILWSLSSSEAIRAIISTSYKQNRPEDDHGIPVAVQPWGSDRDKRRYYLVEGLDDTHFRVYRESNYTGLERTWWSVAGDIDELKGLAEKLNKEDGGQKARVLSGKILHAIPRFESTEDKRKRREYRQVRKQQFKRVDLGTSLYEGRTRGKRVRYNYSDEDPEGIYSDAASTRRSTRNTGTHTSAEPAGPTITQSGRQVKSRQGGMYGETMLSGAHTAVDYAGTSEEPEEETGTGGRPRRAAAVNHGTNGYSKPKGGRHIDGYNNVDEMSSDEDDASEQDYGDDEEEEEEHVSLASDADDQEEPSDEDEVMEDAEPKKLIVKLQVRKTPTPDRKPMIKLRFSPEKDKEAKPNGLFQNGVDTKENVKPTPVAPTPANAAAASEPVSKPIDIAPVSPQQIKSPLAFRGSPDKPVTFQPAIMQ